MKKLFFILTLVFTTGILLSQQSQSSIFTNGDKLYINLGQDSDFYYTHTVEKGHTIYSLSRAYNVPASKLYSYNGMNEGSSISLGQSLRIPLPDKQMYKGVDLKNISKGHFIPVYYTTQPKDNIFRISRVYFNQPIDDLVKRNNLSDNNLDLGQDLLIGWLPVDGKLPQISVEESELGGEVFESTPSTITSLNTTQPSENLLITDTEENVDSTAIQYPADFNPTLLGNLTYRKDMKIIKKTDVAFWDKTIPDNGAVFGLHGTALLDSYINVFNPNSRRSVRIKVIGRIPYGTYTNDIKLVISPRAAKQLGGLDRRFKVEIDYLTEK